MGLDMYLLKRHYISKLSPTKQETAFRDALSEIQDPLINPERVQYVIEEVGYWRKANAIHQWFVNNVQNGKDECQESYVETDQLKTLLDLVQRVKVDHSLAEELMPTQGGFFFGDTNYDKYYFEDLDVTEQILTTVLAEQGEHPSAEILYRSSW